MFCGIDWASDHHDVVLVGHDGGLLAKARIADDPVGLATLLDLLAGHGESPHAPIPVAIETSRGLLVASLRTTGRRVYAINPMAAARYRDRTAVTGKKSDHLDAMVLANILRTDAAAHRPLPADTELAQGIAILARAQQDAVWDRTQAGNKLRSHLREYFPAFLDAFGDPAKFTGAVARTVLAAAPTPAGATKLTAAKLRGLLRKAGRQRAIDKEAERILAALHGPQMRHLPQVEEAMGHRALALLRQLDAACQSADELEQAATDAFARHPDAEIVSSFPGLGALLGARVLAELGDDRARFTDARALKAYAGSAPITRASGKKISVRVRRVKNDRLASVGYRWSFCALTASPGGRAHYDRRREAGDGHAAALRNLNNRFLGCLYHCLQHRVRYNEATAFPGRTTDQFQA
ncbi:IS110 family transposase [Catenulispora yoronensis]|uniref:IS110 family transposase n=1 Tax=Catenulispora yoronensis TaxID=450799 RepID=UPI003CD0BD72